MITRLVFSWLCYWLFCSSFFIFSKDAESNNPFGLVNTSQEEVQKVLQVMKSVLSPIHPEKKQPPKTVVDLGKSYVLFGDLFGNGETYALVNLEDGDIGVGFAQWFKGCWRIRQLMEIHPDWTAPSERSPDVHGILGAEAPFWTLDLNGRGAIGVVIVGAAWKGWQEHGVYALDKTKNSLRWIGDSMERPYVKEGVLVLRYNSGHKAIFGGATFHRWKKGHLVSEGEWREEVPYNDIDPPFVLGKRTDSDGKEHVYKAVDLESGTDLPGQTLWKDGKEIGKIHFLPFQGPHKNVNYAEMGNAFLFEKFTGLPRDLYPFSYPDSPMRLEQFATVEVTGSKEAKRLFSNSK